jgi:hypothetical protein
MPRGKPAAPNIPFDASKSLEDTRSPTPSIKASAATEPPLETPVLPSAANTSTSVPTSDITTESGTSNPTSALTVLPEAKWVEGNGVRVPFATEVKPDGDEPADPIQFRSTGLVTATFFYRGAKAHTVKWRISEEDENRVKSFISTSPGFVPNGFQYPIDNNHIASANSKVDLHAPFENVYNVRRKEIDDLDEGDLIS